MAKAKVSASGRARGGSNHQAKPDFHRQLVLFQWALGKLGVESLEQFRQRFQVSPDSAEGLSEVTGNHRFYEAIANALLVAPGVLPLARLAAYEQNLLAHTQAINTARQHHGQPTVQWKYHQYLALLLTEVFLDTYFADPDALRRELNETIKAHNERMEERHRQSGAQSETERRVDWVSPIPEDASATEQLARLAFWCATGSGKTLLMHVNLRQFRMYHADACAAGKWPNLDQVILVTPNDGLSEQHRQELAWSGMDAVAAGDSGADGLFADQYRRAVKILSIHKFQDDYGAKTVATGAFEGCNLVLVDEGHRGAGRGDEGKWLLRRDQLAKGGFCVEYSATFKEAIGNEQGMRDRYARSILFDYTYRHFYRDGYGKDFAILNLEDDTKQQRYLTAALLLFYQQLRVWADGSMAIKPFLIDKPLWVFVGHTVVGKASTADDKGSISDVVEVILFLRDFLADAQQSRQLIQSLLEEGFKDSAGRDLLTRRLPHLDTEGDKAKLAAKVHEGLLRDVFNAPGGGALSVQVMKGAAGEVALQVGEGVPFGVVNVGDPLAVVESCAASGVERQADDLGRESLFRGISRDDSPVNILVGSRKFTEGWNSWRVSSLGLMRMGRNEGTQIIQLFGRGVRLRGYRMSLRRSSVLANKPRPPKNLRQVETLQVFGVKASYMNTFRDWIIDEVPEAMAKEVWDLPVVRTLPDRKLKTIRLKDEINNVQVDRGTAFRLLGPLVRLRPPDPTNKEDAYLRAHRTRLNWLPKIRGLIGEDKRISASVGEIGEIPTQKLSSFHVALLDIDELLFGLEAFKATRGLDRLHADRAAIAGLLARSDWYELSATAADMRTDRYENRRQWQRMAQQLVNSYAERLYRIARAQWEAPYLEVVVIDEKNLETRDYTIETTDQVSSAAEIAAIAGMLADLEKAIGADKLAKWSQFSERWKTVPFKGHLYQPLLYVGKNAEIRVSPVPLDKHEAQFVRDLAMWCEAHAGVEVYLLRNAAVTGLGFFQAGNFFPDFLLWVQVGEDQHLAFVDPKGLHHFDPGDAKIQFATNDIPRLQQSVSGQAKDLKLHAFILANTPFSQLGWSGDGGKSMMTKAEIEALGVLFQADDPTTYVDRMLSQIRTANVAGAWASR